MPLTLPERTDPGYSLADNRTKLADPQQSVVTRIRAATRVSFTQRIGRPIDVSLLELGPAKVLHLPDECMIDFQLYAQTLRPDEFLAVAAHGDLGPGYICTEQSFSEGGYEPSASRAGRTSEHVLKAVIRKLIDISANKISRSSLGIVFLKCITSVRTGTAEVPFEGQPIELVTRIVMTIFCALDLGSRVSSVRT